MSENPKYSVILPIYNEQTCLSDILQRIIHSLAQTGGSFEIICVDDCSQDDSWAIINQFHEKYGQIKGLRFSRNFGHQLAVYAGIKHCSGEFIAVLDADGQDPPELLSELFKKCHEGYDVVYAVRKKRKENFLKRFAYNLFYLIYRRLVPFSVPLDSGDFAVFTKNVARFIQSLGEKRPFIRGLRSWYGGRQCGYEYVRQGRLAGKSKYSFCQLMMLAMNGAVSFSKLPLRFVSVVGIVIAFLSFLGGLYVLMLKTFVGINLIGWTSTALLIVFFGGINLFVLGIFGEYLGDVFDEVKNRPPYMIGTSVGFK